MAYLDELIAQKQTGPEKGTLSTPDFDFHTSEFDRLVKELESAHQESNLPEMPTARPALNDLLVRLGLKAIGNSNA